MTKLTRLTRIHWMTGKDVEQPIYVALDKVLWMDRGEITRGLDVKVTREATNIAFAGYSFHVVETPEEIAALSLEQGETKR